MASAGHVPMLAVFDGGGPIGMARAGDAAELAIVGASHVAVTNDGGDGRAVRVALRDAGDEFDRVRLLTGGRGVRAAGCAPVEERLEAVKVDGDTRGQAVDRAADGGGVRLPKMEMRKLSPHMEAIVAPYSSMSSTSPPSRR